MKVYLLVERDNMATVDYWVTDAVDEYTMDEWGGYPDDFKDKLSDDRRVLVVTIPDDALSLPFASPTVEGTIVNDS